MLRVPVHSLCVPSKVKNYNIKSLNDDKKYIQDGHPADQRPVYDLQRLWGREYEQAGVCLLLEWLDKEGLSSSPDDSGAKHE